jgi:hypothetical protein
MTKKKGCLLLSFIARFQIIWETIGANGFTVGPAQAPSRTLTRLLAGQVPDLRVRLDSWARVRRGHARLCHTRTLWRDDISIGHTSCNA